MLSDFVTMVATYLFCFLGEDEVRHDVRVHFKKDDNDDESRKDT